MFYNPQNDNRFIAVCGPPKSALKLNEPALIFILHQKLVLNNKKKHVKGQKFKSPSSTVCTGTRHPWQSNKWIGPPAIFISEKISTIRQRNFFFCKRENDFLLRTSSDKIFINSREVIMAPEGSAIFDISRVD